MSQYPKTTAELKETQSVTAVSLEFHSNVGKTMINHPFGNGLYHLFMVKLGIVYGIVLPALGKTLEHQTNTQHLENGTGFAKFLQCLSKALQIRLRLMVAQMTLSDTSKTLFFAFNIYVYVLYIYAYIIYVYTV